MREAEEKHEILPGRLFGKLQLFIDENNEKYVSFDAN
jgi:hypothetical protein